MFAGRFPVMFDKKAAVPMPLPVVVGMESQVDHYPDTLLSGWDMEVGVPDISQTGWPCWPVWDTVPVRLRPCWPG